MRVTLKKRLLRWRGKKMSRNIENDIGYIWLCQITKSLREQGQITKVQERKINKLNAEKLKADIIVNY